MGCFDGASVMQGGGGGGVADLQIDDCDHSKVTWSAAHINQLANGDAFDDDDYYWEFRRIMDATAAHYSHSAKSKASVNKATEALTGKKEVRSLGSLNAI